MCFAKFTQSFRRIVLRQNRLTVSYRRPIFETVISSTDDAVRVFRNVWDNDLINLQEQVYVIFLDASNRQIAWRCIHTGGLWHTIIDPIVIFSEALTCLASGIVIAHNHPSGSIQPTEADVEVTENIEKLCHLHHITFLDHIILTEFDYFSFNESGFNFKQTS